MRKSSLAWLFALAVGTAGCDGSTDPDAGASDAQVPAEDARVDAGNEQPSEPPRVTSTRPRNGEMEVAGDRELEVRFSAAMSASAGTVRARVGTTDIPLGATTWNDEADVLFVAPASRWPSSSRVDVTIEGFADRSGTEMEEPYELVFHTGDEGPPSVLEASPAEGATDVDVALAEIALRFSEPMNPYVGELTLTGGPGELGARSWPSPDELRVEVAGLEAGKDYRVELAGFEDVAGNPLDGALVLLDDALDFTTAPDTTVPTLVDSNPTNGQLDVLVAALPEIVLRFDEPMDTSVRTASLDDGESTTTLTGNWSPDGLELRFVAAGRLRLDARHRLDVSELRDRAGNALDPETGLTDGALEFTTTAADEAFPFVQFSAPAEGDAEVRTRITSIAILFSEAMDIARNTVELVGGGETRTLAGAWNAAGTRLTLALETPLPGHTAYSIDLSAFTDASGNALDVSHPYLGDGVLDFVTGVPTGESCADPLTVAEATRDGDAHVFSLLGGRFATSDQPPSCAATNLRDGFVEYEKTTGELGTAGGRALRITATADGANRFNLLSLEVSSGACERSEAAHAREVCVGPRREWIQYLDAPAGTYFITVAMSNSSGAQSDWTGLELRIEEVGAIPEGESCHDPFDTTSAIYTSPAPGEHSFRVPHGAGTSVEQGESTAGADGFSCVSSAHGPDAVIRVDKERAGSILDVTVEPFPVSSGTVHVEARSSCARGAGIEHVRACNRGSGFTPQNFQVDGPAGPVWLWLASSAPDVPLLRTAVDVREIDPGLGESCATAIPLTVNTTNAVTPESTADYFHPSCLPAGPVTWYRYRTTREVTTVIADGVQPLAMIDAASARELECVADATLANVGRRMPVGTDVCVAIPSTGTPVSLSVHELDWRGITGTPSSLAIERPVNDTGSPVTITSEAWLEADATNLYMGISVTSNLSAGVVIAPRVGGTSELMRTPAHTVIGYGGALHGQTLFSINEASSGTAAANRLYRLINSAGTLEPSGTVWDPGSIYPSVALRGLTRIVGQDELAIAGASSSAGATFLTASATAPGSVLTRGTNADVTAIHAIAADATYVYFTGTARIDGTTRTSVYRLPWSDLGQAPRLLAPWTSVSVSSSNAGIVYDPATDILYFRSTRSGEEGVYAVFDASTDAPTFAGRVVAIGRSSDAGLALDPAIPALLLFETQSESTGNFVEVR